MSTDTQLSRLGALEVEIRLKAAGEIWEAQSADMDRTVFGGPRPQLPRGATLSDVKGEVYLRVVARLNRGPWSFSDNRHLLATLRLIKDQVLHEFSRRRGENAVESLAEVPGPATLTPSSKVAHAEWLNRQLAWWEDKKRALSPEDRWLYEQRQLAGRDWNEIAADHLRREGLTAWSTEDLARRANTLQRRWNRLLDDLRGSSPAE